MKKTLPAVIILLLTITGCSRKMPPATEASPGSRIMSAAPSNTEIIIGLGAADRIIAADKYSLALSGLPSGLREGLPEGWPEGIYEIDFFHPDVEAVIGLMPDLVLSNEINSFGVADNPFKLLENLGIRVIEVPASTSIEGIYNDILLIAEALDIKERGISLVESIKEEVNQIAEAVNGRPRVNVYFEVSAAPTMVTFGKGAYLDEMLSIAGGENIFSDQRGWFSPSAEEIISRNPDVIFALANPGEDPVAEIMNRSAFKDISAVIEKRVYAVDADSASRASQNIMTAFRQIASALNPELQ